MTLRHRPRHVHKTMLENVRAILAANDWMAEPAAFGTPPVTLIDYQPLEASEVPAINTVAVTLGDEAADTAQQLGGDLWETAYPVFVDIFPANQAIGVAIADDIKQAWRDLTIPLLDFTTDETGADSGETLELRTVVVQSIPTSGSSIDTRSWRVVKATAAAQYQD